MPNHNYFVYIITNSNRTVLYVGVTNDLNRRLEEHYENSKIRKTFAGLYYCYYLVYFERHSQITHAIEREKEIKKWSRKKKEVLIDNFNPMWRFLNEDIHE